MHVYVCLLVFSNVDHNITSSFMVYDVIVKLSEQKKGKSKLIDSSVNNDDVQ